ASPSQPLPYFNKNCLSRAQDLSRQIRDKNGQKNETENKCDKKLGTFVTGIAATMQESRQDE
ncbi:MAG: hypothetical protein PHU25_21485, partial [Deltaproteobacteria bacterium]|nr:hypothetical protein [Deltaproteobacteria bacterium]